MIIPQKSKDERTLSLLTLITNTGDFISLFVFLKLIENITGSILIASYSIGIRALGVALAAATFGLVSSNRKLKTVIFVTQGLAGCLTAILALLVATNHSTANTPFVFCVYLAITILNQWFTIARDSFGDSIGELHEKRGVISAIVSGYFGAQVLGSIIGFFLISNFQISIPLSIDALTFFIAALLSLRLIESFGTPKYIPFSGIKAIAGNRGISTIFFLRAFVYWIPVAVFNFYRFSYITNHLHLDSIHSVWIDVALGAGGLFAANMLITKRFGFEQKKDYILAIGALLALAACRFLLLVSNLLAIALIILFIAGIFNSVNAICTRSIRAKLTQTVKAQRSNIISLEQIVGQFTVFLITSLCSLISINGELGYRMGFVVSGILLVAVSGLHMAKRIRV